MAGNTMVRKSKRNLLLGVKPKLGLSNTKQFIFICNKWITKPVFTLIIQKISFH